MRALAEFDPQSSGEQKCYGLPIADLVIINETLPSHSSCLSKCHISQLSRVEKA